MRNNNGKANASTIILFCVIFIAIGVAFLFVVKIIGKVSNLELNQSKIAWSVSETSTKLDKSLTTIVADSKSTKNRVENISRDMRLAVDKISQKEEQIEDSFDKLDLNTKNSVAFLAKQHDSVVSSFDRFNAEMQMQIAALNKKTDDANELITKVDKDTKDSVTKINQQNDEAKVALDNLSKKHEDTEKSITKLGEDVMTGFENVAAQNLEIKTAISKVGTDMDSAKNSIAMLEKGHTEVKDSMVGMGKKMENLDNKSEETKIAFNSLVKDTNSKMKDLKRIQETTIKIVLQNAVFQLSNYEMILSEKANSWLADDKAKKKVAELKTCKKQLAELMSQSEESFETAMKSIVSVTIAQLNDYESMLNERGNNMLDKLFNDKEIKAELEDVKKAKMELAQLTEN